MKSNLIKMLTMLIMALFMCATCASTAVAENNSASESSSGSSKSTHSSKSKSSKSSSSSTSKKSSSSDSKKSSSKSSASTSSKSTKSSSTSSKSSKSSKSGPKKRPDRLDKRAERASNATQPIFSQEQIDEFRSMPFETWESPTETSEAGLPIEPGFAQPYPYGNLMRQFQTGNCKHGGHDIGIVKEGPNNGMGSVINAIVRAEITLIGKTGKDEGEFGKQDKRTGEGKRDGGTFPRQILVPGYGLVYPFSLNYGRWHSGMVIVTKVLDGPLKDHTIRYMHMADIRPDLKVGDIIEPGEHIAIMGATAILDSSPHVHIDAATPGGKRVDLAPYIGLPKIARHCAAPAPTKASTSSKSSSTKKSSKSSSAKTSSKSKSSSSKSSSKSSTKSTSVKKRSSYTRAPAVTDIPETRTLARS